MLRSNSLLNFLGKRMSSKSISIVCCDASPAQLSRIVPSTIDDDYIDANLLETIEQNVAANEEREMHNAAHHAEHGPVTYLQQVNEGGFAVLVGPASDLQETFFGPGSLIAFIDDEGPGHASKVGPDGVSRTLRVLKGHVQFPG